MAAARFKGVRSQICLDCNDIVKNLFHKCFTNSASIVHRRHHSHVRTRANAIQCCGLMRLNGSGPRLGDNETRENKVELESVDVRV